MLAITTRPAATKIVFLPHGPIRLKNHSPSKRRSSVASQSISAQPLANQGRFLQATERTDYDPIRWSSVAEFGVEPMISNPSIPGAWRS